MGSLLISNKILEKYFGYLKHLDRKTKKNLIEKLIKSLETNPKGNFNFESLYGAWEDERTSDEIIEEIRASRVEKGNIEGL